MSDKLNEAVRSLQRARESAEQRLLEIQKERDELRASVKSLDAALRALGKRAATVTAAKSAATTAEVTDLVAELLSTGAELTDQQLSQGVGELLLEKGKSRAGLRLRLKQALKNERFTATEKGYALRAGSPGSRIQQQSPGEAEK